MRNICLLLCAMGCNAVTGDPDRDDTDSGGDTDTGDSLEEVCSTWQNLEVVVVDLWGRDVNASVEFNYDPLLIDLPGAGENSLGLPLGSESLNLGIRATAEDYHDVVVWLSYGGEAGAFAFDQSSEHGRVVATSDTRALYGVSCPVFTVYLGLEHQWFSAQASPPSLNAFELYMGNAEGWDAMVEEVSEAREQVLWSSWFWESDVELVRPAGHETMTQSEREPYTAMAILDALGSVDRKILINRFWGENTDYTIYLNTDSALRARAETAGDGFDVVLQGNPTEVPLMGQYVPDVPDFSLLERLQQRPEFAGRTPEWTDGEESRRAASLEAASYHQKMVVVDGEVAFVTGMNTKAADWDTAEHRVFDARRMEFDASLSERAEVTNKETLPDLGPRRDYTARVEGPAVRDIARVFHSRWEQALADDLIYTENATGFSLPARLDEPANGVPVQVTLTMPEPAPEMSILETHRNAILQATDYVFIEDQFFRSPLLNDAIAQRMLEVDDLLLVVVTNEVGDWDPGLKFTYLADQYFKSQFGDRYLVLQLRTTDVVVEEGTFWDDVWVYDEQVFNHAKLRIIDDRYLSVGSANVNNRSYLYDGEMNVSVLDTNTAVQARRRIYDNLVGDFYREYLSDDSQNNLDVFRMCAEYNDDLMAWWEANGDSLSAAEAEQIWKDYPPDGFLRQVGFSSDYLEVGPDMF